MIYQNSAQIYQDGETIWNRLERARGTGLLPGPEAPEPLDLSETWPPRQPYGDAAEPGRTVDSLTGAGVPATTDSAFDEITQRLATDNRNADLQWGLERLQTQIQERLTSQREARKAELGKEREAVRQRGRLALDRLNNLENQKGAASALLDDRRGALSRSRAAALEVKSRRPEPLNFPSPAEVSKWQDAMRQVRASVEAAENEYGNVQRAIHQIDVELGAASAEVERLRGEHEMLEARIAGREWRELGSGLIHPAGTLE